MQKNLYDTAHAAFIMGPGFGAITKLSANFLKHYFNVTLAGII
jgi:hypothetical protein